VAFQQVLNIQALGTFKVEQTGRIIKIPRAKERALIAFLAVNAGRTFRREYIAQFLWPRATQDKARHSLNQAISTIRRILPHLLVTDQTTLSIAKSAVTTDLDALRDSIAAGKVLECLSLITGEFLGDVALSDVEDFENWRSNYNRDLFFRLNDAIQLEFDAAPRTQQNAIALKLSSIPSEVLPAIRIPGCEARTSELSAQAANPNLEERFVLPFVGRDSQLAAVMGSWQLAQDGVPQFVVVDGHAGHGKSRLLDEFVALLKVQSALVMRARCYKSGKGLSLGPFIEVLSNCIQPEDLLGLQPIWISALQEIIPALPVPTAPLPQLSQAASQSRLFEAMLRIITSLATRAPVMICLDDIQWLDKSSSTFLDFLSNRLANTRVLILLAQRSNSSSPPFPEEGKKWVFIKVGELSESDIRAALRDLPRGSSRMPTVRDLERSTKGHPFLVSEVVKSALSSTQKAETLVGEPNNVESFVRGLLEELPQSAQNTAAALAVIGRPASMSLLSAVARAPQVGGSIDLLIRKDIAYQAGVRVGFRHDIVSEVVYHAIPPFSRREMHKRAALILSRRKNRSGEAAEHFLKARNRRNAYRFALVAASQAESRYSNEESIYFLQLARRASPFSQPGLLSKLAERLYRAHRIDEAREVFSELLANPGVPANDRVVVAVRDLELGYDQGLISAQELRRQLHEIKTTAPDNSTTVAEILYLLARSAFHNGDRVSGAAASYELKTLAEYSLSRGGMEALALAAHFHSTWVSAKEADEWVAPLRARLDDVDDHEQKLRILVALTGVAYAVGRLKEALNYADAAGNEIERIGAMNLWPVNAAYTHMLYVEQGRFTDAIRLRVLVKERLSNMFLDISSTVSANAALMHYERGDFAEALAEVAFGLSAAVNRQSAWTDLVLHGIQGLAALEMGDLTTAGRNADFGKARIDTLGTRMTDLSYVEILIARVDTLRGRSPEAIARLGTAIQDYESRDKVCQLRMKLEQARLLRKEHRAVARTIAKEVYDNARQMNAVLIAEKADALLLRL
jgi:tetratricopeptide (TPR) repeat protein